MSLDRRDLATRLAMTPVAVPAPPSQAAIDEVEKVRGMQVRKDAVDFATRLAYTNPTSVEQVMQVAVAIAAYIETGELSADDDPAPLRP